MVAYLSYTGIYILETCTSMILKKPYTTLQAKANQCSAVLQYTTILFAIDLDISFIFLLIQALVEFIIQIPTYYLGEDHCFFGVGSWSI